MQICFSGLRVGRGRRRGPPPVQAGLRGRPLTLLFQRLGHGRGQQEEGRHAQAQGTLQVGISYRGNTIQDEITVPDFLQCSECESEM